MKKQLLLVLLFLGVIATAAAKNGTEGNSRAVGEVRNVIVMIPDGTSTSVVAASRWFQIYGGGARQLNLDPWFCGFVSSFSPNSPIPDSAAAMSGYMTGMPTSSGFISIYPAPDPAQDFIEVDHTLAYQPLATLMEAARHTRGMATGVVATTHFCHATPAACTSHHYDRGNYAALARQMAASDLDLVIAGGGKHLPEDARKLLEQKGATLAETIEDFRAFEGDGPLWALLAPGQMEYEIDRDEAEQPSLAEMTRRAIEILSQDKKGFFLMVEGSRVDMAAHANDPATILHEFLAFDRAFGEALRFAREEGHTAIVVMPDHGTSAFTFGNRNYHGYTTKGLESLCGVVAKYRCSAERLEQALQQAAPERIREIVKQQTDLDLTDAELNRILRAKGIKVDDYMEVSNSENLYSAISSILTARTPFGFVSGNHTGEDVFLAAYHPKGNQPAGRNTNSEINGYIAALMGLGRNDLEALTGELYVPHTELAAGYEALILETGAPTPVLLLQKGDHKVLVPAFGDEAQVDGKEVNLGSVTVYIDRNKTFYLPRGLKAYLK